MRTDRLLGISNSLIRKLQDLPSLVLLGNPCADSSGTLVTWVISSTFEKRCDKGHDHFPQPGNVLLPWSGRNGHYLLPQAGALSTAFHVGMEPLFRKFGRFPRFIHSAFISLFTLLSIFYISFLSSAPSPNLPSEIDPKSFTLSMFMVVCIFF